MDQGSLNHLGEALPQAILPIIHVEVCQRTCSTSRQADIEEHVKKLFTHHRTCYGDVTMTEFEDEFLKENVAAVSVCDTEFFNRDKKVMDLCSPEVQFHIFQLHQDGPGQEELDGEDLAAASHWLLPSADFHGLWDNLIFDSDIKSQLLQYSRTTLLFSDKNVNSNVIAWNRVILLHGPPGTGKTSLCKALSQKLVIQLSDRYSYGQLIEINSHSLFSKWFSESGKLVMKMFQKIQELIDDENSLVCVLIDEVESLTAARKSALNGTEPSDAIRVVNALLTQLDAIKKYPNVLILTTSNITGAIDLAFVDRADIKQYIGPPAPCAIYRIYQSCITELMKTEIIKPSEQIFDLKSLELMNYATNDATTRSLKLKAVSEKSNGLSGRTLRKLPFIAHAVFIQAAEVTLDKFLDALSLAVDRQFQERDDLAAT